MWVEADFILEARGLVGGINRGGLLWRRRRPLALNGRGPLEVLACYPLAGGTESLPEFRKLGLEVLQAAGGSWFSGHLRSFMTRLVM